MATVLRGGRWRSVSRQNAHRNTSSRSAPVHSKPGADQATAVVCFVPDKNAMGVSIYHPEDGEISVCAAQVDNEFSIVPFVMEKIGPCAVVIPSSLKRNSAFLLALNKGRPSDLPRTAERAPPSESSRDEDTAEEDLDCSVSVISQSEVNMSRAVQVVSMVSVLSMPLDISSEERWSYLQHVFDGSKVAVRATAGLLSHLLNANILLAQGDCEDLICVTAISYNNIYSGLHMSATTLSSLQVFQVDSHPLGRGKGQAKEGLSVFGIIRSHIKSAPGARTLREWLKTPLTDCDAISDRQTVVDAFRASANHGFYTSIRDGLRGVRNVAGILKRIRTVSASIQDWQGLYSSAKSFAIIIDAFKAAARSDSQLQASSLHSRISEIAVGDIRQVISLIEAVLDLGESKKAGRLTIAHGFSTEIDELRTCYSGLDDFLTNVGIQEMKRIMQHQSHLQLKSLLMTYQPQIGYLILLEHSDADRVGLTDLKDSGFDYMFSSLDQGKFFKNEQCYKLDSDLGDIHGAIMDLESKAVRYLESKVLPLGQTMYTSLLISNELDCLQALAVCADEYKWKRPTVSNEFDGLNIEAGRHALLELNVAAFVPNSTFIRAGDVNVVTGPNFSGKSVYLKQVALIVILCQIGSCVPAMQCVIRPFASIHTRISNFESLALGYSSFFLDSVQVATMLTSRQQPSLILIDEFGKGTSEIDGIALLAATLRSFLKRPATDGISCLCATHFVDILTREILPMEAVRLATFSMEVMEAPQAAASMPGGGNMDGRKIRRRLLGSAGRRTMPAPNDPDDEECVRTYRVLRGSVCAESRAVQCALEQGIDRQILSRAVEIRAAIRQGVGGTIRVPPLDTRVELCLWEAHKFLDEDLATESKTC